MADQINSDALTILRVELVVRPNHLLMSEWKMQRINLRLACGQGKGFDRAGIGHEDRVRRCVQIHVHNDFGMPGA